MKVPLNNLQGKSLITSNQASLSAIYKSYPPLWLSLLGLDFASLSSQSTKSTSFVTESKEVSIRSLPRRAISIEDEIQIEGEEDQLSISAEREEEEVRETFQRKREESRAKRDSLRLSLSRIRESSAREKNVS
jgi:hypothetical protein